MRSRQKLVAGTCASALELADDGTQIVGESSFSYTPAGRMTSSSTKVDAGIQRASSFAWDGGGRTTGVSVSGRASHSRFDPQGRVVESNAGAGSALVILDSFSHSQPSAFDGWLPQRSVSTDRSGASFTSIAKHDTAGNATENSVGPLRWTQQFDQLGALTSATEPSRNATTYTTDARGAVKTETLPGGAVNAFAYHPNGAQASYTDPASVEERRLRAHLRRLRPPGPPQDHHQKHHRNARSHRPVRAAAYLQRVDEIMEKEELLSSVAAEAAEEENSK